MGSLRRSLLQGGFAPAGDWNDVLSRVHCGAIFDPFRAALRCRLFLDSPSGNMQEARPFVSFGVAPRNKLLPN